MKIKNICVLTLLIAGSSLKMFADDKIVVKSTLKEATIFFQGAELTHSATSALVKGDNEILVEGLSPNIDKNSLKIKTSNGVVVSSFEFSVDYLSGSKSSNTGLKKIQDSIDFYNQKMALLDTDIRVNSELADILKKSTDKNVSGSENGLKIDDLIKTMDYYKTKSTELLNAQKNNNNSKLSIQNALNRLTAQQRQESVKNNKTSGILKLNLTAPLSTTSNLSISYYTAAASWTPYYDLNVISTDKPIKITSKAKVRQVTGLDWDKVKLTLSSATPSNGKIAPLFSVWFLQDMYANYPSSALMGRSAIAQNSYSYGKKSRNSTKEVAAMKDASRDEQLVSAPLYIVDGTPVDVDYFSAIDPNMIKDTQTLNGGQAIGIYGSEASAGAIVVSLKNSMDDYISVSDNELNTVFNIDLPYSVPGNGKEQSIELQTKETEAEYKYYCAPRLDGETYLLAEISDWQKLGLLSGKANVTYDGTYVGESFIDASSTHSKLPLTLGTDKRVAVKREKMQDYSSGAKFLGNDTKQVFTYKLTVKNNQNKAVKMVLKDQYPRSQEKAIEVELLKETTTWTANIEETGVITWEDDFNAGETKVYQISYSVKYPKGRKLNL